MPDDRDAGDDPFRTAPHGHSPTLARLATQHPTALAIREVDHVAPVDEIVGARLGAPAPTGCWLALAYLVTVGAVVGWLPGWVSTTTLALCAGSVVAAHAAAGVARWAWRRRMRRRLTWVERQAFPITGVRGFLCATRRMIDIEFTLPPTPAALAAALQQRLPGAEVRTIDARTLRIVAPARAADAPTAAPLWTSLVPGVTDDAWLRLLVDEVLAPLHAELGVVRVHLGGHYRPAELAPGAAADPPVSPPART